MESHSPDTRQTWLTEGLDVEFGTFIPMGSKAAKSAKGEEAIFSLYSVGVVTSRDSLVYSYELESLKERVTHLLKYTIPQSIGSEDMLPQRRLKISLTQKIRASNGAIVLKYR